MNAGSDASQTETQADSTPVEAADPWLVPLRWVLVAGFLAVPLLAPFFQSYAGLVTWTTVTTSIPLFVVLAGYHRWRRVCPLAFVAQIPTFLKRAGTRRAGPWLDANSCYIVLFLFVFAIWLRLIATNGNAIALSLFFLVVMAAALVSGFIFTGKTWCNYICPVSFIESIYSEPRGLRETPNSQCAKCTACKKACPDINAENSYWREVEGRAKRFTYLVFPGLVLGFYAYYSLQSGDPGYYFKGLWGNQPDVFRTAFLPGHDAHTAGFFFLPEMPRAVAALLTLFLAGGASWLLFTALEKPLGSWLRRREPESTPARLNNVMFALASFTAFVTFYTFAGGPLLRQAPSFVGHLFLILVVATATAALYRRVARTQEEFREETVARNIIKRWKWADVEVPEDAHDAYLIHTIRTSESARSAAQVLQAYREAVAEALADGFVTRRDVQMLEALRDRLQIKKADHEKVMAELAEQERQVLNDPSRQVTAEKRLQLQTYERSLREHLESALTPEGRLDEHYVARLRAEYGVTPEEHAAALGRVMGSEEGLFSSRFADEVRMIERAAQSISTLTRDPSPTRNLLAHYLQRLRNDAIDRLLRGLSTAAPEVEAEIRRKLASDKPGERLGAIETLSQQLNATAGRQLRTAHDGVIADAYKTTTVGEALGRWTQHGDPYVRAVSIYASWEIDPRSINMAHFLEEEHELVRETARQILAADRPDRELSTVEKMVVLFVTPIFSSLGTSELAELARVSIERRYADGETLCRQGDPGTEVFVIVSGEARVEIADGGAPTFVSTERAGAILGELAAIDPAPRAATIVAGAEGVRVLCLDDQSFLHALDVNTAIARGVLRTLVRRLRGSSPRSAGK